MPDQSLFPEAPLLPTPQSATTDNMPTNPFLAVRELLNAPLRPLERSLEGRRSSALALVIGGLVATTMYGLAAGTFEGGANIVEAGLKAPLVMIVTLLLCAPSLWVFPSLAGVRWTASAFGAVLASFVGLAGLVLLGLLPVAWLFSASSRFLGFVTVVHVLCWTLALGLAGSYLQRALAVLGGRAGAGLWTILALAVSLQVATVLRPLLWRESGTAVFTGEKLFFLEHFGEVTKKHQPQADDR